MAALGFAPWGLWPLTLLGIACLFALADAAANWRGAALRGWCFGVGHFTVGFGWIAHAFVYQDKMPVALGWVVVVGLAMFLAIYVALAAGLARGLALRALPRLLVLAASWMLGEWLRGWVLSGFAWNPLGAAWLAAPAIVQLAQFGGALALSGLVVIAGGTLWLLVRPGATSPDRRGALALIAAIMVAGLAATLLETSPSAGGGTPVILVQPNIGEDERYLPGAQEAHLKAYLDLTRAALARQPAAEPALVVWSEGSVPWLVEEEPAVRAVLAAALRPGDLLLFGGTSAFRDSDTRLTALGNSLFVLDARGQISGRFDKAHLVPLGEYVPAKPLLTVLGLARLVPGDLEFRPGPGARTLALPGFPSVGVQICYEIIFPGAVVDRARRPAWIVNVSNDSWYGPSGPPQFLDQARLRAIEEGLPIVHATPTGISAMIDAQGRLSAVMGEGVRGSTVAKLPPASPPTVFARFGHSVAAIFGLLLLGFGLWLDRRAPFRRPAAAII